MINILIDNQLIPYSKYIRMLSIFQFFGKSWFLSKYKSNDRTLKVFSRIGMFKLPIGNQNDIKHLENYSLNQDTLDIIAVKTLEMMSNWWKEQIIGEDSSQLWYRGISLPEIVETEIGIPIYSALMVIEEMKKALQDNNIKHVQLFGIPEYNKLLSQIKNQQDIHYNIQSSNVLSKLNKIRRIFFRPNLLPQCLGYQKNQSVRKSNINFHMEYKDKKVLVIVSGNSDVLLASELVKTSSFYPGINIKVVTVKKTEEIVKRSKVNYNKISDYSEIKHLRKQLKLFNIFGHIWKKHKSNDSLLSKYFIYEGINLWCIILDHLHYIFRIRFPESMFLIDIVERIIKDEKPEVVIVTNSTWWVNRCFVEVAKKSMIPTVSIPDGVIPALFPWKDTSDLITVINDKTAKIVKRYSSKNSKIIVTGSPRFDPLFKDKLIPMDKTRMSLGLSMGKKIILFATEPGSLVSSPSEKEKHEDAVISAAKEMKDCILIIKLHPQDNGKISNNLLKKHNLTDAILIKDFNANSLLNICDLLITGYSTMAIEAIIQNRPVLLLNFFGKIFHYDLVQEKVARYITNPGCLLKQIRVELYDTKRRKLLSKLRLSFLNNNFNWTDGNSSQRVLTIINQAIKK